MITVILAFCALIATLEFIHFRERKDLYDRMMSRNIDEYKRISDNKKTPEDLRESQHQKAVNAWRKGN